MRKLFSQQQQNTQQEPIQFDDKALWLDPGIPLAYSVSSGIVFAVLTGLVIRLWPRSR
ncbi:hypothetical protein F7734_33955 [Scytonema sp. UIC 10036]|uniref:hypothetical protein n=1 Tax=Scytonema sp. UIC 10036 TaxID=2304196 RepID=UPI0012DA2BD3|nr:hypothetical protein [Scytonema sp. UIC 10036]MUG97076.1 hypothetical protein [Scytonema sp. UIC 10036]